MTGGQSSIHQINPLHVEKKKSQILRIFNTNYSFVTYFVRLAIYSQQKTEHLLMVIK